MSNTVLESVVGGEVALDVSRVQEELLSAVDRPLIDELVARARREGLELSGPNGLLAALTKRVLEAALEGEITEHLGYERHDPAGRTGGNSRNGTRAKTVLTDVGPVEIEVPRIGTGRSNRRSWPSGSGACPGWRAWSCRCPRRV